MSDIVHTRGNSTPMEYDLTAYEGISPLEARFVIKYLQCNKDQLLLILIYQKSIE